MADKRRPACRIIIEESRRRVAVELFPASLFPGGESCDGQYRVRVGRTWLRPGGQRYVFWTKPEVLALLSWIADGRPDMKPAPEPTPQTVSAPRPDLVKGTPVYLENGRVTPEGLRLRDRTFTMTEPFQGPDGQWRAFLVGCTDPVLVDDLLR